MYSGDESRLWVHRTNNIRRNEGGDITRMNIVFVTHLDGNKAAGLSYSIPAQIQAISKIARVLWFNDGKYKHNSWEYSGVFLSSHDISGLDIEDFPSPFNRPDIVVFQSFYSLSDYRLSRYLVKNDIPYVIIPRGALTKGAQRKKKLKKTVANLLLFKRFASDAAAIQYLTQQEYLDSGNAWNFNKLVIPNGIEGKSDVKVWRERKGLNGVFVGRLDIFHKGLDLLIEACRANRTLMIERVCTIDIYGPPSEQSGKIQGLIRDAELEGILSLRGPVYDENKVNVLLGSDFFILPSRFEGHPMGLLEALSYGIPCLITTGTNMAQEISEANAGWVADTTSKSLANAMNRLLTAEHEDFKEKGKNAVALSKQYEWGQIAKQTVQAFEQIVGSRAK